MQFILTGFTQETGFRVFAFEGVAADRSRTPFRVKADLALIRRYGISIQELPLLCRVLLETRGESGPQHTLTYSEEDMCLHASGCAAAKAAAELKKKAPRRPPATNGSAWRAPMGAR